MTTKLFLKDLSDTFGICLELATRKNKDYADEDPFKNFRMSALIGIEPAKAIIVRILDKLSRVSNLLDKENSVKDERIEDTLMDIINYTAILKAYLNEK